MVLQRSAFQAIFRVYICKNNCMSEKASGAVLVIAVLAIFIGGFLAARWLGNNEKDVSSQEQKNSLTANEEGEIKATVSGSIVFDRLKPEEGDAGEVILYARKSNTNDEFIRLTSGPVLKNESPWIFDSAVSDMSYDFRATLVIDGNEVTRSPIVTTAAPADDVRLTLTVSWSDLPAGSIEDSYKTIAGKVVVSGYIPEGATVSIFGAKKRDNSQINAEEIVSPTYEEVMRGVPAKQEMEISWEKALASVQYLAHAELFDKNGKLIGTSDNMQAAYGQQNLVLNLESEAVAPPSYVEVSGAVRVNGSYKDDNKITVQVRKDGTGGYTDFTEFPVNSARTWKFDKADNGASYDFRAIMTRQDEENSRSKHESAVAAASDVKLTIDTTYDLQEPVEIPELEDCEKEGEDNYIAKIHYPGIEKARNYWLKMGKSKDGADILNESETPNDTGDGKTVKVKIAKNKYYYTEYAYSYCSECTTLDSFSDFSERLKFYCGKEPN